MKIGIFDSGLGGLVILKSLKAHLPGYDYLYLGDTKRVPYGPRSQEQIYKFTQQAVDYLFQNNCQLIILACNSASSRALRKIQQQHLPRKYPGRRVLGVIIPTVETARSLSRVGVLATAATAKSHAYKKELRKLNPKISVWELAAPELVPLIENEQLDETKIYLRRYLQKFKQRRVQAVILGCTHYPIIRNLIQKEIGPKIKIISQTEIIPQKLQDYLARHPEIKKLLSRSGRIDFHVTKLTPTIQKKAQHWFGTKTKLLKVNLGKT